MSNMKLAFTTLGCPEWDLQTIADKAVEYGFDGVDFRGYGNELDIFKLPEFTTELDQTVKIFSDAGLDVPCLSSSVRAFAPTDEARRAAVEEVANYAALCEPFGARFIRIFGGHIGDTPRDNAVSIAVETLDALADAAAPHGVEILLETHDDWVDCQEVRQVMERVKSDTIGILWDTHHPFRMLGEEPEETCRVLGAWIRNAHVKDSYVDADNQDGCQHCLVGEGDIPLAKIVKALEHIRYDGYLTLEWEKKWHPEIPGAEIAFPAYVRCMRNLMAGG